MVDRHPDMGLDVLTPQEHAQQRLAVRQPADAEVAEERLRGDVAELDLLVQTSLAQPKCGIEQELVRRAETARALRRGDHHIARIARKPRQASPARTASGREVIVTAFSARPGTASILLR